VSQHGGGINMSRIQRDVDNYQDDDFYTEEEIETLLEDDEISASEEAFMRGYIDA
jgi:hypothetical protein